MTPAARLQAAIALLDEIEATPRPADAVVSAWFRARRFIGSHDRPAVAEAVGAVEAAAVCRIGWALIRRDGAALLAEVASLHERGQEMRRVAEEVVRHLVIRDERKAAAARDADEAEDAAAEAAAAAAAADAGSAAASPIGE